MRMSDWSSDVCSSDLGQPPQLCSPDFYRACRARLNANGILVVNLCDHAGKNEPILRRLRECFGRIITISVEVGMNLVVFAFRDERDRFDREKMREAAMILQREHPLPMAGLVDNLSTEERRGGKECGSSCRSRGGP